MLQHRPNVTKIGGITGEWSWTFGATVLQLEPAVTSLVYQERSEVLLGLMRVGGPNNTATAARIASDSQD